MPTDDGAFNLLDAPWIVALDRSGVESKLSILDVFEQCEELATLGGEVSTQGFAITRLLLAFLHRAVDGPQDDGAWGGLWSAATLPMDRIHAYADRVRDRFGLFDPERPFMQVAGLTTTSGAISGLAKIVADVPDGERLFTTRTSTSLDRMSAAEAARWLVNVQAFDPSGIKSGVVGDPDVKGGRSYPIGTGWSGQIGGVLVEGSTVRQTLLLNLVAHDNGCNLTIAGKDDLPTWERAPSTPGDEDREPTGAIDLYTWQTRRVRLVGDAASVTGVVLSNGDRIAPQNRHGLGPHTVWRYSEPQSRKLKQVVWMPRLHDPERQFWRGMAGLLAVRSEHRTSEPTKGGVLGPPVLGWLAELSGAGHLPWPFTPRVRAIGLQYGSNNSVVDDVIDDGIPLDVALLSDRSPELAALAVDAVRNADDAVFCLWRLAENLAQAAGAEAKSGAGDAARETAFAVLDLPYRRWLAAVHPAVDREAHRASWHKLVASRLTILAEELVEAASPAAWMGREINGHVVNVPAADAAFRRSLYKALPLAVHQPRDEE